MVKNCARNRSIPDKIDTETEICTSLKSEFYFRFRWPPSTKSTLISHILVRVFVTIRLKICPPQSRNSQNWILHISKIGNLLPVCLRYNSLRNNQITSAMQNLVKIGQEFADVIVRQPICGQTYTHTDRQTDRNQWLDSLSNAFDRQLTAPVTVEDWFQPSAAPQQWHHVTWPGDDGEEEFIGPRVNECLIRSAGEILADRQRYTGEHGRRFDKRPESTLMRPSSFSERARRRLIGTADSGDKLMLPALSVADGGNLTEISATLTSLSSQLRRHR